MSEVKRYNLFGHHRPDGQMVAFEDYEKLKAENAKLKQALEIQRQVADAINDNGQQAFKLQQLNTKLQKKVEILTEALEATANCCTGLIHAKITQALKDAESVK